MNAKWINVKERLPKVGDWVVVWDGYRMLIASMELCGKDLNQIEWFWRDEGQDDYWNGSTITHWLDGITHPLTNRKKFL